MKEKETKPKYNVWQNTLFVIKRAWKHQPLILFTTFFIALLIVAENVTQLYIAPVVLEKVETATTLKELILVICIFVALLIVIKWFQGYMYNFDSANKIDLRFTFVTDINEKYFTTSYANLESTKFNQLFSRAQDTTTSNWAATERVWSILSNLLANVVGLIIYLILLFNVNPFLICVILITTITSFLFTKKAIKWEFNHREEYNEHIHRLSYVNKQAGARTLSKDIRIFGLQPWIQDVAESTKRLFVAFSEKTQNKYLFANIMDVVLTFLRNGIAYAYLIYLTLTNNMSAAEFLFYFNAAGGFSEWIIGTLHTYAELSNQSTELSCLREFLDIEEVFLFEEGKPLEISSDEAYTIELHNVSYRYPESDVDTFHNLNLTLRAGEKLAIVGLNGAGKTTLVKLLCGLYDPTEGEVLLNGQDIRQYNRNDYYKLFSAVFQDFNLLECSLAENIAQCLSDIDMEKVKECIEKAGLTSKVAELPKQEMTHLGKEIYPEGIELSGGQTQRLILARALYKDAPIMILDEPTAALDPIAENDIYMKYNEMTQQKSSIFISHRLASTRFCDRIIFLADGSIVEEGTHDELIKANKGYADLFAVQSRYYQEGGNEDGTDEI